MFSAHRVLWVRLMVAAGGGLLLSATFPGIGVAGAAWIAPGVILFSAVGCRPKAAFALGYAGGLAHYLSSLYWLLAMPDSWHGIPLGPAAGWLALSAYCALFPAAWVWLCWKLWGTPAATASLPMRESLPQFFSSRLWQRAGWAFGAALIWVALEMARGRLLTGFPWNFLGASQYKMLPVIQIASVTGVYGVSFLVAWTSVSLMVALLALTRQPGRGAWAEAGLPLLTAVGVAVAGAGKVAVIPPAELELSVALVQPAFPQTIIWSTNQDEARVEKMLALSSQALAGKASLLIWPEGALPSLTSEWQSSLAKLLGPRGSWLLASADDSAISARGEVEDYNACFLMKPDGVLTGVYHKRRLVIFGEYVPSWLAFLKWVTPIDGAYTPGTEAVQFKMRNPDAQYSVLICFEDVFPGEAREHVTPDTDFLVNLTDDGWFGDGVQPWQHAANAVFRAVENGVPLVRCTNNGLTCWIDAQGRLREIFSEAGSVYGTGFMTAKIPLRLGGDRSRTFYNRHGDWFGWSCCGLSLCLLAGTLRRSKKLA